MSSPEQFEQQVQEVLATEACAMALSNRLFRPDGPFNQPAPTEEERRTISRLAFFQQAQRRLSELQQAEAAECPRLAAQPNSAWSLRR